jgi:hypothetical protein
MTFDFSTWTRADFQAFDAAKAAALAPTPEETAAQAEAVAASQSAKVNAYLSRVGMDVSAERDLAFLLEFAARIDAKQFVGENVEGWVADQVKEFSTPSEALRHFICRYL